MLSPRNLAVVAVMIFVATLSPGAYAQWAVVDAGAIAQLVQQVKTMREQLTTARNQLDEAQKQYRSMHGRRGMEQLLAGTARNYLPSDWAEIQATAQGGGSHAGLGAMIQSKVSANALLTAAQVAALAPDERAQVEASRQSAAILQVLTRQALQAAGSRFAAVQQLINAIPAAQDQKAILDLQARIAAEQGMLANEQVKLEVLYQAAQAEEWARRQRAREAAIAGIGSLRRLPPMGL